MCGLYCWVSLVTFLDVPLVQMQNNIVLFQSAFFVACPSGIHGSAVQRFRYFQLRQSPTLVHLKKLSSPVLKVVL